MIVTQHGVIRIGTQTVPKTLARPRHFHVDGQAEVCLLGSFVEPTFAGRLPVSPGDVLIHRRFHCHAARGTGSREIVLLTLAWDDATIEGRFRVADPDFLARLARKDAREASEYLVGAIDSVSTPHHDWIDILARELRQNLSLSLGDWAEEQGLRRETISRGFKSVFGVSPQRFALELRARQAWWKVYNSPQSLTEIAHEFGFADLPHLSRSIRALTGRTPTYWRSRRVGFDLGTDEIHDR